MMRAFRSHFRREVSPDSIVAVTLALPLAATVSETVSEEAPSSACDSSDVESFTVASLNGDVGAAASAGSVCVDCDAWSSSEDAENSERADVEAESKWWDTRKPFS